MTYRRFLLISTGGLGALALMGAVLSGAALAQQAPESLLPPGFDKPAVRAKPRPAPAPPAAEPAPRAPAPARIVPGFAVEPGAPATPAPPNTSEGVIVPVPQAHIGGVIQLPDGVTSFQSLISLPEDKLDQLLGLRPKYDIPPAAQRALKEVGVVDVAEGGLAPFALAHQSPDLVRAVLAGNHGQIVSRWGHILLRRALASRLDAPDGMDPADFIALRSALLLRMGEADAARALVQDVDPDNYNASLAQSAFDAYIATADLTGFCPVLTAVGGAMGATDPQWQTERAFCQAFSGNAAAGMASIDRLSRDQAMDRVDMLLAQKYAGAAGTAGRGGRRAVKIEWDGVSGLTPWRYALAIATGLSVPPKLVSDAGTHYDYITATAPMAGLGVRADASDNAGAAGVLSAAAMVDLYGQVYAQDDITGGPADRALLVRDAYLGQSPDDRLKAMQGLWDGAANPNARYGRVALTAYAAARLPVSGQMAKSAPDLIAAMLAAGLDANAARWMGVVDKGSTAWGLLAVGVPGLEKADAGLIDDFAHDDASEGHRRSAFLAAGLAGLGRITLAEGRDKADKYGRNLDGATRWTNAIDGAAGVNNPVLVSLLAGLGMQGDSWAKMTPRYLYHIVAALKRVGLEPEARMIAAEAVARG